MEFKPIETQEQLDAVIADRVKRAEESAAKKYSDYEDLKQSNEDYEKQITELTNGLKEKDAKIAENGEKVKSLEAKVHEYETASVKTRIAHEEGLPYELASKLSGDDEDAIRADAKTMAKFVSKPEAPLGSGEPVDNGDPAKAAYSSMLQSLRKE